MKKRPRKCRGCPLHPDSKGYDPETCGGFVPPEGPKSAEMLIVGMAPGEEEEERGKPFVGASGRKIRRALAWAGDGLSIRVVNLVNCRTKKLGFRGVTINRDPTAREIRACAERFLWAELAETRAKVIVPAGQLAYEWLTFYVAERKGAGAESEWKPSDLPKSLKLPGGLAGKFTSGIGHRIVVPRGFYEEAAGRGEK